MNFFDKNDADCFSPTDSSSAFVQAWKNHEYRGTPESFKSLEGHQGRIEQSIRDDDNDAKMHIEALANRVKSDLEDAVELIILDTESDVADFGLTHDYSQTHGPNWGLDIEALGSGQHSRWTGSDWTYCDQQPENF